MREVVLQIPTLESEQNIDIDVKINGKKRTMHYRVEIVDWDDYNGETADKVDVIKRVIKERLSIPNLISDEQLKKLKAKILLKFDIDMSIVQFKFLRRSGNRLFDDSIQNAIDRVRTEVRALPTPPEAIAGVVFGRGIAITLHGTDVR